MTPGPEDPDARTTESDDSGTPLLPAWRVRLSSRQRAWIQALSTARGVSQVAALRALLERGHRLGDSSLDEQPNAQVHARLTELGGEIEALSASISELHDLVQEIATVLATLGTAYGKVWVESLMANRLLLDAHHRGLVERARDMTSRYLERGKTTSGAAEDPS
jgi:hypothetical protein